MINNAQDYVQNMQPILNNFSSHENKPSMIAKVATVLGENAHNISRMEVVQKTGEADNESIMIINTDESVSEVVLSKITEIDGVRVAKCVNINI